MQDPVERGLHPRRAAGLEGRARRVQPDVGAAREEPREPHVVVLQEHRGIGPLADGPDQPRDHGLAGPIGGVRLSGEDELELAALQQAPDPVDVAKHQVGALVGRRPPRHRDGEHVRGEPHVGSPLDLGQKISLQPLAEGLERVVAPERSRHARGPARWGRARRS